MRRPRIRYTIGGFMALVLVAGVGLWYVFIARPRLERVGADYRQAKLVREVAEYAVKEYVEGVYRQDKATYLGQIALAKVDKERAMDRLGRSARRGKQGPPSPPPIADRLALQQADFDLEQAMTKLKVLEGYTKRKQIKSLNGDVEKARADELTKFEAYRDEWKRLWRFGL